MARERFNTRLRLSAARLVLCLGLGSSRSAHLPSPGPCHRHDSARESPWQPPSRPRPATVESGCLSLRAAFAASAPAAGVTSLRPGLPALRLCAQLFWGACQWLPAEPPTGSDPRAAAAGYPARAGFRAQKSAQKRAPTSCPQTAAISVLACQPSVAAAVLRFTHVRVSALAPRYVSCSSDKRSVGPSATQI